MKANLKGLGGIKGLVLLHGEKLAMALVALVALYFIYSSLNLPSLDDTRQADDLQRRSLRRVAPSSNRSGLPIPMIRDSTR